MSMTYTDASNNRCCTCQYWKGERRYDARMKRVHYENFASDLEPCSMKFGPSFKSVDSPFRPVVKVVALIAA